MKLATREIPGAVVVEVNGKLVGGPDNSGEFHTFVKSLLNEGKNRVVVNLSKTPWANSQGIGMLIGAHTSLANAGGELVLVHVNDRIMELLNVTRLLLIFKTLPNEEEAVKHFARGEQD